jgi:WD40 repeat protein
MADWGADLIWQVPCDLGDSYHLHFSNTDKYIVANGCRFYDVIDGHEIARIYCSEYYDVYFIENDAKFIKGDGGKGKFYIWDANTFQIIDSLESIENEGINLGGALISRDEKYLYCTINKDSITPGFRVWDLTTKKIIASKFYDPGPPPGPGYQLRSFLSIAVGWTCDDKILTYIRKLYLYFENGVPYYKGSGSRIIYNVYLDSIGTHNISGYISKKCKYMIQYSSGTPTDWHQTLKIYDFNTMELVWDMPVANEQGIVQYDLDPSENFIITAGSRLKIWSIKTKQLVWEYPGINQTYFGISHNGKYIINDMNLLELLKAHFEDTLSVKKEAESITEQTIYPNPTTGAFTLKFKQPKSEITEINIRDLQGALVRTLHNALIEEGMQSLNFNVGEMTSGVYFLTVLNSNLSMTIKLIIIK